MKRCSRRWNHRRPRLARRSARCEPTWRARATSSWPGVTGWAPLVATAHFRLGSLLEKRSAHAEAEVELERAYLTALRGVAPLVAYDAATALVYVVGVSQARHAEGRHWARLAEVALQDVPDGEHVQGTSLLVNIASLHNATGDYDEAERVHEQALAIREAALGPEHPLVATSLNNLANVYTATDRYAEAKALYERVLSIRQAALGPEHPHVANTLNNLANVHQTMGNPQAARQLHERVLAIRQAALGPRHRDVAATLNNLAVLHETTGDPEAAKELNSRAIEILEAALGPEHPEVANSLENLANVHMTTGDHEAAKRLYERALAINERSLGPAHPEVASSLGGLGNVHVPLGDYEAAEELHERALAIYEQSLGPEHPKVASSLVGLADVALARGRPADAVLLAERALTLREKGDAQTGPLANARFLLARALWDAPIAGGEDRVRARALAEHAREGFQAVGMPKELAEVERWLDAHVAERAAEALDVAPRSSPSKRGSGRDEATPR
jgi:tetratricopeptide (TPR) repeat protein